ncbi:MAG: right-handed parallel beta-helix repeat-containing protein [Opitutus sp.]|nr:right-handed parallel beta-helix repeat-containing protein [Opitutus sp.]
MSSPFPGDGVALGAGRAIRNLRTVVQSLALAATGVAAFAALPVDVGPQSPPVDLSRYAQVRYVDARRGDDIAGNGSREKPWASLPHALEQSSVPAAGQRVALLVAAGRYTPPTFALKPRVDLFGGFASAGGAALTRDIYAHATVLDGGEAQRIAFGADDVRIDGFHFVRGRVRGKGAALLCDGVSPTIANCIFTQNRTLIPQPWAPAQLHETAHDGGAIFITNGAAPRIEHCYFYDNTTECGRGAAIAADRRAAPRIVASVFANNRSGLDDPMRSSDGGAISFFDWCAGEVTGCVVSANVSLARNDAGGIFVALWSAPRIADNVFTANNGGDDAGALFIGGQEHRYDAPLDSYPPADKFNVLIERNVFVGNTNSSKNSGAMRVTMESRATFRDNLITENQGGFYLQRSEIVAERNTVWQDWRFVEDKPSLGRSRLAGNILKGPLGGKVGARATLARNMAEAAAGGSDSVAVADVFEADGIEGKIAGVRYDVATFTTAISVAADLSRESLAGRLIGFSQGKGAQWRVIQRATAREIVVWGRLEPETKGARGFTVLRTFSLKPDAPAGIGARVK